jgi:hypothetical protein
VAGIPARVQLAEALQKAVEAKQSGDELAAAQLALDNLCREIRSLLYPYCSGAETIPTSVILKLTLFG